MEQVNQNPLPTVPKPTTNRWKWVLFSLAVADFWGMWLMPINDHQVPLDVAIKYRALGKGHDVVLQKCSKRNETMYQLYVGIGSPVIFYFNAFGIENGYFLTDNPNPRGERAPPVNMFGYNCKSIARSRPDRPSY